MKNLFNSSEEENLKYYEPFLEFLCIIFSKLGEECVKIIKGEIDKEDFVLYPFYNNAFKKIKSEFPTININQFEQAMTKFFQDKNYEFDQLKWNLAQSFYITKALGLDEKDDVLSKEIFSDSDFYLDTNVLISALEPNDKFHLAFLAFNNACKKLNIKLKVAQITLDELDGWLSSQYDIMMKTFHLISPEISPRINTAIYKNYIEKKAIDKNFKVEDVFLNFLEPLDNLRKKFNVELIDDNWFYNNKNNSETQNFALILRNRYINMRSHKKSRFAALHDSLILLWIIKEKEFKKENIWLATLDTTLPAIYPNSYKKNSNLAITLGALLQWIFPVAISRREEKNFSTLFSEIIKSRLMPKERVFELSDFLIFDQLNIASNELPSEDVIGCIEHIKRRAPSLNPLDPSDMINLSYEVNKYFVDPSRKYKTSLVDLERKLTDSEDLRKEESKQFNDFKQEIKVEKLRSSAKKRISIMVILFVVLEGFIIYLSTLYGEGTNIYLKILSFWPFIALTFPIIFFITILFLQKDRIDAMGWKLKVFFKKQIGE